MCAEFVKVLVNMPSRSKSRLPPLVTAGEDIDDFGRLPRPLLLSLMDRHTKEVAEEEYLIRFPLDDVLQELLPLGVREVLEHFRCYHLALK